MSDPTVAHEVATQVANAAVASDQIRWLARGLGFLLVGSAVALGARTRMLRDDSGGVDPPYSFARAQLLWWTLIIGVAFLMYFGTHGVMPPINSTCLALLGIGAGTTTMAKIIDSRQRAVAEERGMATANAGAKSRWFLEDILSDEKGVSIHRFQALFFNATYGVAYLVNVSREWKLPDYEVETWSLLGLSSAGYLGLKALENKTPAEPPGQNDELIDTGAAPSSPTAVG